MTVGITDRALNAAVAASEIPAGEWLADLSSVIEIAGFDTVTDYNITGVSISPDGNHLLIGNRYNNTIRSYSLPSPGLVSGAVSTGENISTVSVGYSAAWSFNGLSVYYLGYGTGRVYQRNLSSAYSLDSPGSLVSASVSSSPTGLAIAIDGSCVFIVFNNGVVRKYLMPTPGSVSGMTLDQTFSTGLDLTRSIAISDDGLKLYVGSLDSLILREYDLAGPYDIDSPVQGADASITGTGAAFSLNGRFFTTGSGAEIKQFQTYSGD